ncbi:MAG TPA: hypothetical protein VN310_19110, partial [Candidatus Dormibacteraeota bacterium]|nr:hypothetical protein [Candidatus Dormibacteraeota bacterium]
PFCVPRTSSSARNMVRRVRAGELPRSSEPTGQAMRISLYRYEDINDAERLAQDPAFPAESERKMFAILLRR